MPTIAARFCIALITLAFCTTALAQESFSTLEERMTGKEYHDTGLHKLSDEELAALNEWIRARSLTQQEVAELNEQRAAGSGSTASAAVDRRGLPESSEERRPIESRIVGDFDGWDGETVFELENGMIWEQQVPDLFSTPTMENPRVTIKPGFLGSWRLQVEGYNTSIQVRRIE